MFERSENPGFLRSPLSDFEPNSWSLSKIAVFENLSTSNAKRSFESAKRRRLSFGSSRKTKNHSKSTLLKKFLWLIVVVLIPLYLPYLLVKLQVPSLFRNDNSGISQSSNTSQQSSHQNTNYQDRKSFMNVASIKAGTRIYELDCFDSETPKSNFIISNRHSSLLNSSKCKDLKPLIEEKTTEHWSYFGKKGSLYVEFRESVRIFAVGLEFYEWETKWLISSQGHIVIRGINLAEDKQSDRSYVETDLIEFEVGRYDASEKYEEKIRLYYDCKASQCYEKYQGVIFEFYNPNPSNLKSNIEKIFVFERF